MDKINGLTYFLNSIKETLPFENKKDLIEKIKENKEFRVKVQKLVYLSKYFGWENNYHFNFHQRGPYSIELTHDYQNLFESLKSPSEFPNFRINSFKKFIANQDNDFFEATSTILYYFNKLNLKSIDKDTTISILSYLKPHISKIDIGKSYEKIMENNLFDCEFSNQKIFLSKEIVLDKLDGLINIFENFEDCSNKTLLLGSLDYFRIALRRENLKNNQKMELLKVIYDYGDFIENYYFTNYTLEENFSYLDLTIIDDKFDKLQDYISDLKILPRLYDEDVDLNIFCE